MGYWVTRLLVGGRGAIVVLRGVGRGVLKRGRRSLLSRGGVLHRLLGSTLSRGGGFYRSLRLGRGRISSCGGVGVRKGRRCNGLEGLCSKTGTREGRCFHVCSRLLGRGGSLGGSCRGFIGTGGTRCLEGEGASSRGSMSTLGLGLRGTETYVSSLRTGGRFFCRRDVRLGGQLSICCSLRRNGGSIFSAIANVISRLRGTFQIAFRFARPDLGNVTRLFEGRGTGVRCRCTGVRCISGVFSGVVGTRGDLGRGRRGFRAGGGVMRRLCPQFCCLVGGGGLILRRVSGLGE